MIDTMRCTCHRLHRVTHHVLNAGAERDIPLGLHAAMNASGQKAGMFARTIIVQGRRLPAALGKLYQDRLLKRPMAAAFERRGIKPRLLQHRSGPRDMFLLTGMRGAGHGEIGILKAEGIRRAAFDQRKSLNGFDGRTRKCRALYIAQRKNIAAIAIDHRDGTTMAAFDDRATINFHQNRIAFHHFNLTPSGTVCRKCKILARKIRNSLQIASPTCRGWGFQWRVFVD